MRTFVELKEIGQCAHYTLIMFGMNWFEAYFIENFTLVCLCLVLLIISIQRFHQHPTISLCTVGIVLIALTLSIVVRVQEAARASNNLYLTLTMGILGYVLRPCCIFLLILMNNRLIPKKYLWIAAIPLVINLIIYLCAYIPNSENIIFGYTTSQYDGQLHFEGGHLRFASHVVSALYLAFLIYISFADLKAMHLEHGLAILICAVFVVAAVLIEMFSNGGDIELLNVTIAAGTTIYYLFLYMERTQIDTLTGLFNRETYYRDSMKMGNGCVGVIQFDMNGLKYINDNLGHLEGDKALATIAHTISGSLRHGMYAYRLGGDEFLVIATSGSEESIQKAVSDFKAKLAKTDYRCSIGYAYRSGKEQSFTDLLKEAEKKMYADKEEFYKNAPFDRRKAEKV